MRKWLRVKNKPHKPILPANIHTTQVQRIKTVYLDDKEIWNMKEHDHLEN